MMVTWSHHFYSFWIFLGTDNFDIINFTYAFIFMLLCSDWTTYFYSDSFLYNYYFDLVFLTHFLDTLVKFSNTCLVSQDPYWSILDLFPTKIDSDFFWSFSERFLSEIEFIKLLSIWENFGIQTQPAQSMKTLKWRFKQRNLSNFKVYLY